MALSQTPVSYTHLDVYKRQLLDAALTMHQERIRASTDESFGEALAQFRANLGGAEELLREAAENVTTRSLSELELRVETLKQQTVEDLIKSAEWYEKRAQTQTQSCLLYTSRCV